MTDRVVYSVIVPVHNVRTYLSACLDSLLAQRNAPPWEAILVDDGSTDGSGAVCDEYAGKCSGFRVLHVPNGGVSRARNLGINAAGGDYIVFLDADDLLDPEALAALFPLLEKKPDITLFCSQDFDAAGKKEPRRPPVFPQEGETGDAFFRRSLETGKLPFVSACMHVFSSAFLRRNGLQFQEGLSVAEDLNFTFQCLSQAASVCGTDRVLYYYRQREGSATKLPSPEKQLMEGMVLVKWFRRYPYPAIANYYTRRLTGVSRLGPPARVKDIDALYRKNRDIPAQAGERDMKIAAALFRFFGLYRGSVIACQAIGARNRLRSGTAAEQRRPAP